MLLQVLVMQQRMLARLLMESLIVLKSSLVKQVKTLNLQRVLLVHPLAHPQANPLVQHIHQAEAVENVMKKNKTD